MSWHPEDPRSWGGWAPHDPRWGRHQPAWGWGHPGAVRRTRDGVNWEETQSEAVGGVWASYGGLAFGKGKFVLADRSPYFSSDGSDWVAGHEADFRGLNGEIVWSVRDFNFIADPTASRIATSVAGGIVVAAGRFVTRAAVARVRIQRARCVG